MKADRATVGHELGPVTVNLVVNLAVLGVALLVALLVTGGDVPVVALLVVLGTVAIALPILFYPVSQTVWMGLDLAFRAPDDEEMAEMSIAAAFPDEDP